jgi:hypothetical protein
MSRSGRRLLAASFFLFAFAAPARGTVVTRGPYLQTGTPTSVLVCWRTDVSADSRVSYGTAPDALTLVADDRVSTTEHAVLLSALTPSTAYWYSVGTASSTLAGDASFFFVTAPAAGSAEPLRIWVIGDSGTADANQQAVRSAYQVFTGARRTDLWLMLGDNAYESGTDPEFQRAVFDAYPFLLRSTVLWPTFGNHDGGSARSSTQSGPYYDIFRLPRGGEAGGVPSGTEAYYSFDFGNVHFVCLDAYGSARTPGSPMLLWLQQDLASTRQDWIVAFWHHPPYTKGTHDSDTEVELVEMRQNAVPILEAGGTDLVLCGHSHVYERSFLIDGHYGVSSTFTGAMKKDGGDGRETGTGAYWKPLARTPHAGTVYVVAGVGGRLGTGRLDHPAMFSSMSAWGSLALDVEGGRLDLKFVLSTGAIADSFTIVKSAHRLLRIDRSRDVPARRLPGP